MLECRRDATEESTQFSVAVVEMVLQWVCVCVWVWARMCAWV